MKVYMMDKTKQRPGWEIDAEIMEYKSREDAERRSDKMIRWLEGWNADKAVIEPDGRIWMVAYACTTATCMCLTHNPVSWMEVVSVEDVGRADGA